MNFHGGTQKKGVIDLSASVSPLGLHPSAKNALKVCSLFPEKLSKYPEIDSQTLRALLGEFWNFPKDSIIVGHGASDLISLVCSAIFHGAKSAARFQPHVYGEKCAVVLEPSFSEYSRSLSSLGFEVRHVLTNDVRAFLSKTENSSEKNPSAPPVFSLSSTEKMLLPVFAGASVVFASSPQNPSGEIFSTNELFSLARVCASSGALLVLDSCFAQFSFEAEQSLRALILRRAEFQSVVVINAFTKFYGMASLRVGYALCFGGAGVFNSFLRPWSVDGVSLKCAESILQTELFEKSDWTKNIRKIVLSEKEKLCSFFSKNKIEFFDGKANFVLFRIPKERIKIKQNLETALLEKNIAIRNCSDFFSLDSSYFRASIFGNGKTERLICALREILGIDEKSFFVQKKKKTRPIMIQGTASNAGKSMICTALCRILRDDGFRVAPFKSQNMALNSFVTKNALEIARAQVVQSLACGLEPTAEMNPILLKPEGNSQSQVVLIGKETGRMSARDYFSFRKSLVPLILDSYEKIAFERDVVVVEGAGSPAEINLLSDDIVNMGLASLLDSPVLLATDIDKGGAFASIFGTFALVPDEARQRIRGFLLNRFRGDKSLLDSGIVSLEKMTLVPTVGVIPFVEDLKIDSEDSLSDFPPPKKNAVIKIGIVRLPFLSNSGDFLPLARLPFVSVEFFERTEEIEKFDAIILPGTKNVVASCDFLFSRGFFEAIRDFSQKNPVIGICGGFQILGKTIDDKNGIEDSSKRIVRALSLLPSNSTFQKEKIKMRVDEKIPLISGVFSFFSGLSVSGYELHHGKTHYDGKDVRFLAFENVFGTYVHGFFDSEEIVFAFSDFLLQRRGLKINFDKNSFLVSSLECEIARLAKIVRDSLDMKKIYDIIFEEKP